MLRLYVRSFFHYNLRQWQWLLVKSIPASSVFSGKGLRHFECISTFHVRSQLKFHFCFFKESSNFMYIDKYPLFSTDSLRLGMQEDLDEMRREEEEMRRRKAKKLKKH